MLFKNNRTPGGNDSEVLASRRKFIVNFAFFLILFGLSVLIVRYALPALVSFLIAFIVTLILRPLLHLCTNKLKFNRKITALILVLLFYATIGVAVVAIVISIINWGSVLVSKLPDFYKNNIVPGLGGALEKIESIFEEITQRFNIDLLPKPSEIITDGTMGATGEIKFDFSEYVGKFVNSLGTAIADFSKNLVSKTPQMAATASGALLKVIICIISTAFLLTDYDLIANFLHKQMKPESSLKVKQVSEHLGKVLKKYILSYALIMFITFIEILVGLLIIRMPNAPLIASVVAVFDILPIVGSGMVLLPWAIITLFLGHVGRGIGLLVLWAVVVIVRQIIEPKIVGNHVGMHPLLTLFAMIAGNFIYGGIGIVLLPVSLALIQSLNEDGVIHIYESLEEDDIPKEDNGVIVTAVSKPMRNAWSKVRRLNDKARRDLEEAKKRTERKKHGSAADSEDGEKDTDSGDKTDDKAPNNKNKP